MKRELEKADGGLIHLLAMESMSVRLKLVTKPSKEQLNELANMLYSLAIQKQIRDLERIQQVLNMFSWQGCQYAYLSLHFGQQIVDKCGHCQHCLTGSPLPFTVPTSTFELTEELALLELSKQKKDLVRLQERMRIAIPGMSNTKTCSLFGLEWYWHIHELDLDNFPFVVSFPQGSLTSPEARNYTAFRSIEEFKQKADWKRNNHLFEVLLPNQPRHFFADLEWDGFQLPDDAAVINSFCSFLNVIFKEVCSAEVDFSRIQTCSATGVGERGPWKDVPKVSYHARVPMDRVFKDQQDFKKFYHYFHNRVCSPKTPDEEKWAKNLFYAKKGKTKPIYDLSITTSIQNFKMPYNSNKNSTRVMTPSNTSSPDIADHIVGYYDNKLPCWNLDHLSIGTDLPLGLVYRF